jgi:NitT/TauT family transport system ATP-binding protein/sulfonate transport system ATP-binding protein
MLRGREVREPGADRGMVFQSYTLFPWLTVGENIAYGLREKGMPVAQRADIVRAYIEKVGLRASRTTTRSSSPAACSSAPAIARALANAPAILCSTSPSGPWTIRPAR